LTLRAVSEEGKKPRYMLRGESVHRDPATARGESIIDEKELRVLKKIRPDWGGLPPEKKGRKGGEVIWRSCGVYTHNLEFR